jgi:hypothetical protein
MLFFHKNLLYESHWIFVGSPSGENSPPKIIMLGTPGLLGENALNQFYAAP